MIGKRGVRRRHSIPLAQRPKEALGPGDARDGQDSRTGRRRRFAFTEWPKRSESCLHPERRRRSTRSRPERHHPQCRTPATRRRRARVEALAQTSGRRGSLCEIARRHQQDVDRAGQLQMLVAVVEDVHAATETSLRQPSRPGAIEETSTGVPRNARASICGSSPDRSTGSSTRSPSLTTTTPSADFRARSRG